jgi:hypothetical protein
MPVRIRHAGSLRFPGLGSSSQGQSGPKPRPIGVGDGKQANIPAPPRKALKRGGTEKGSSAIYWMVVQPRRLNG